MSVTARYPARQFAGARILLGLYLACFFFWVAPYAGALYSPEGIYAETVETPFPNVLDLADSSAAATAFAVGLGALSLVFAAGPARRVLAVGIWYGYACLFERLIYVSIPQAPFVGWILLATALVPRGEPGLGRRGAARGAAEWRMPGAFLVSAWLVLALPYFASGLSKLGSPSFVDGQALGQILASPIGRRWWLTDLLEAVPLLLPLLTWGSVALELLFAPLCVGSRTRALAWLSMSAMHVGIVLTMGIADVPVGMLVYHAFVFDVGWLRRWRREGPRGATGAGTAPAQEADATRGF